MNIVAFSGSLRADSLNTKLVHALQGLAPSGMQITVVPIDKMPLYNSDLEAAFPAEAKKMKEAIEAADGVIFATPEYNRSIPGVLKNMIDWCSRPWGQNSFVGKPVLVMGVSVGRLGTAVAQTHLKEIMLYLDGKVIGQPELYFGPADALFDASGAIADTHAKESLTAALAVLAKRGA